MLVAGCLLMHLSRVPTEAVVDEDAGWRVRAAERVRTAVRVVLSRPWLSGAALLRVVCHQLESRNAGLVSPRGQPIAAPHLSMHFHPADLRAIVESWPVRVLAAEFAVGYVDAARRTGLHRVADHVTVHVGADDNVPLGRLKLTPAFEAPRQRDPDSEASVLNTCPPAAGAQTLLSGPRPTPVDGTPPTVANPTVRMPENPTLRVPPGTPRRVEHERQSA